MICFRFIAPTIIFGSWLFIMNTLCCYILPQYLCYCTSASFCLPLAFSYLRALLLKATCMQRIIFLLYFLFPHKFSSTWIWISWSFQLAIYVYLVLYILPWLLHGLSKLMVICCCWCRYLLESYVRNDEVSFYVNQLICYNLNTRVWKFLNTSSQSWYHKSE